MESAGQAAIAASPRAEGSGQAGFAGQPEENFEDEEIADDGLSTVAGDSVMSGGDDDAPTITHTDRQWTRNRDTTPLATVVNSAVAGTASNPAVAGTPEPSERIPRVGSCAWY